MPQSLLSRPWKAAHKDDVRKHTLYSIKESFGFLSHYVQSDFGPENLLKRFKPPRSLKRNNFVIALSITGDIF